jgi:hypothetical protein
MLSGQAGSAFQADYRSFLKKASNLAQGSGDVLGLVVEVEVGAALDEDEFSRLLGLGVHGATASRSCVNWIRVRDGTTTSSMTTFDYRYTLRKVNDGERIAAG